MKSRIHLPGSGRAVRYETLTVEQVEKCEQLAAVALTKESTVLEFQNAAAREGVELMIREVSKPVAKAKLEAGEVTWEKVGAEQLHGKLGDYFTPKDINALKSIYLREHVVTKEEVDSILEGKVLEVD